MKKINKRIEIVCSNQEGLSSMSEPSRLAILKVLKKYYKQASITIVNNLEDLQNLVASKPDLVFLGMKFIPSDPSLGFRDPNKIWIAQYLEQNNIAYTGSGHKAHELELNKHLAKQRALDAGLATSPFYVAVQNEVQIRDNMPLKFPLFIKPTSRGGGLGVDSFSVATDFAQLESKVLSLATSLRSDSLIEEYLPGREFSVAILKDQESSELWLMPLELVAPKDKNGQRILSEMVKGADTESFMEVTDPAIKAKVTTLALNIFEALGGRDYGRIDIRLDEMGTPMFLEANLLPSLLRGYGNFPKACMLNLNLDYEPMVLSIAQLGLARCEEVYS